ncbi:MAG: hypothetical protein ACI8S3_002050, partial [Alphaproteobacteria bacterium]
SLAFVFFTSHRSVSVYGWVIASAEQPDKGLQQAMSAYLRFTTALHPIPAVNHNRCLRQKLTHSRREGRS